MKNILKQFKRLKTGLRIPCLYIADLDLEKIVEIDASDVGYEGILRQKYLDGHKSIVQFTSSHWNDTQMNYSTIKKLLSIYSFEYKKISK